QPVRNGLDPQTTQGLINTAYRLPNFRVTSILKNTHVPLAPGHSQNVFFMACVACGIAKRTVVLTLFTELRRSRSSDLANESRQGFCRTMSQTGPGQLRLRRACGEH